MTVSRKWEIRKIPFGSPGLMPEHLFSIICFLIAEFSCFLIDLFYLDKFDPEIQLFSGHLMISIKCDRFLIFGRYFYRKRLSKLV